MSKKHEKPLKPLYTRWGKALGDAQPLSEYPRPQMVRDDYTCLNGLWEYAIVDGITRTPPKNFDGKILVPFSPEALLSGVNREVKAGQTLFYRRTVALSVQKGKRTLLHFGAVDQACEVYCNGFTVGGHSGGYWPFTLDISHCVRDGENELLVVVNDGTAASDEAYGKQSTKRGGIWYTPQSGIWQTVWAESVPQCYIEGYLVTPLFDAAAVSVQVNIAQGDADVPVFVEVLCGSESIARGNAHNGTVRLNMPDFHAWSTDDPFLYDLRITAGEDTVTGYFAMRKFSKMKDRNGHARLALNNKPIFHNGLLDQGYWSDGMYTAPSDEAMVWEIETLKEMGFNTLRKHIKIEPLRWYYHCDRLGMLVWQDFVSGGAPYSPVVMQILPFLNIHIGDANHRLFGRRSANGRAVFERDMQRTVALLYNSPSLALWVLFNEGWGQFDAVRIEENLRTLDSTRPIDHASGWHDQGAGDLCSRHIYYKKFRMKKDKHSRVQALTEFGGYSCPSSGHMSSNRLFGYQMYGNTGMLNDAVEKLYRSEVLPQVKNGLAAAIYTQVSDVEDEINGVMSYDREVIKLDKELMRRISEDILLLM